MSERERDPELQALLDEVDRMMVNDPRAATLGRIAALCTSFANRRSGEAKAFLFGVTALSMLSAHDDAEAHPRRLDVAGDLLTMISAALEVLAPGDEDLGEALDTVVSLIQLDVAEVKLCGTDREKKITVDLDQHAADFEQWAASLQLSGQATAEPAAEPAEVHFRRAGAAYDALLGGDVVGQVFRDGRLWVAVDADGSWVAATSTRREAGQALVR